LLLSIPIPFPQLQMQTSHIIFMSHPLWSSSNKPKKNNKKESLTQCHPSSPTVPHFVLLLRCRWPLELWLPVCRWSVCAAPVPRIALCGCNGTVMAHRFPAIGIPRPGRIYLMWWWRGVVVGIAGRVGALGWVRRPRGRLGRHMPDAGFWRLMGIVRVLLGVVRWVWLRIWWVMLGVRCIGMHSW
jgi:hypothetical protein